MIRKTIHRLRVALSAAASAWREHGQTSAEHTGVTAPEAHVLRGLVEAGGAGILDERLPMTEWRSALHSLVKKGLATAYRPTPLGRAVDRMVREGTIPLFDHESSADAAPKKPDWDPIAAERFRRDWEEAKKYQDVDNPRLFRGAPYIDRYVFRQNCASCRTTTGPLRRFRRSPAWAPDYYCEDCIRSFEADDDC